MPLTSLRLDGAKVSDLGPLRGLRLEELYASKGPSSPILDLSPLEGMPLRILRLDGGHQPSSLAPLKGMPLVEFRAQFGGPILDLVPLRGMPIKVFAGISGDYSPLLNMSFSWFQSDLPSDKALQSMAGLKSSSMTLNLAKVNNIAPLAKVQCKFLTLEHASKIRDLAPLREIAGLEALSVHLFTGSPEALRGHPTLKRISVSRDGTASMRTVEQFWAEYDAKNPKP